MALSKLRAVERPTSADDLIKRFPHLRGGSAAFRRLTANQKLAFLRGAKQPKPPRTQRFLSCRPRIPARTEPFDLVIAPGRGSKGRQIGLVRIHIQFPSGETRDLDYRPRPAEARSGRIVIAGFQSGAAGDLYVSARVYFRDGSTASDATLTTVLSRNPHQMVITPRTWLVSGTAGRAEYDPETERFHCRANATVTNGEDSTVRYRRCHGRVIEVSTGRLLDKFSFSASFTVAAGESAHRTIDTWFRKSSDTWETLDQRLDVMVAFTYEAKGPGEVSDSAIYRPMSTVALNVFETDDFTSFETHAKIDAVGLAAEMLEAHDLTFFAPKWCSMTPAQQSVHSSIRLGWTGTGFDFTEVDDMFEDVSGPGQRRLDVFIPVEFDYTIDVPFNQPHNVAGVAHPEGPVPKDGIPRGSGVCVLLMADDVEWFGVTIAHEICHYLGLHHTDGTESDNLMNENGGETGHTLSPEQVDIIMQHGMVRVLGPED